MNFISSPRFAPPEDSNGLIIDDLEFYPEAHEDGIDLVAEVYEHGMTFKICRVRGGFLAFCDDFKELEPAFSPDWEQAIKDLMQDVNKEIVRSEQ